jgi:hypothetical protein
MDHPSKDVEYRPKPMRFDLNIMAATVYTMSNRQVTIIARGGDTQKSQRNEVNPWAIRQL